MGFDRKEVAAALRRKARLLLEAANAIEADEYFGADENISQSPRRIVASESKEKSNGKHTAKPRQARRGSRREELIAFLKNGPKTRAEILRDTKMPVGTVSTLLNRKDFVCDKEGRWSHCDI